MFAAVGIVSAREVGIDPAKANVNGGPIALGHPLGMSSARIEPRASSLKRRGGGVRAAGLCGVGGQDNALIVHVPTI